MGKVVLVAGGAGFIGSHLCLRLLECGCQVVCMDNLSTGKLRNLASVWADDRFTFILQDIAKPFSLDVKVDEIYNFACPASPIQYQKDPIQTFVSNVMGSKNLLELAKLQNSRILLASTSEVYGDPHVNPQSETYWGNVNPNGIRSCYDEGKRSAETLFCDYHRVYNVDTRVIRIFNTYGPGMDENDGRVVSNFIVQAIEGSPVTVYGDGTQTRSFQYIDDLIEGILRVMRDGVTSFPINLGNPYEITINELAAKVLDLTNSDSKILYKKLPGDDPKLRHPNIELAKKELAGWTPKVCIEEGLLQTIAYFEKQLAKDSEVSETIFLKRNIENKYNKKEAILFISHLVGEAIIARYHQIENGINKDKQCLFWVFDKGNGIDDSCFQKEGINVYRFDVDSLNELRYYPFYDRLYGNEHLIIERFYLDNPSYNYYWVIEYDVIFTGNWSVLFSNFSNSTSDFLSCHIEKYNSKSNYDWVWWNCIGLCQEQAQRIDCLLKSFNPVCRFSNRALAFLDEAFKQKNSGHYEVLPVTLLYNNGYVIEDIGGNGEFVKNKTEFFYTVSAGINSGSMRPYPNYSREEIEKFKLKNKLLHPVKI